MCHCCMHTIKLLIGFVSPKMIKKSWKVPSFDLNGEKSTLVSLYYHVGVQVSNNAAGADFDIWGRNIWKILATSGRG
jgi:hypothetical protein